MTSSFGEQKADFTRRRAQREEGPAPEPSLDFLRARLFTTAVRESTVGEIYGVVRHLSFQELLAEVMRRTAADADNLFCLPSEPKQSRAGAPGAFLPLSLPRRVRVLIRQRPRDQERAERDASQRDALASGLLLRGPSDADRARDGGGDPRPGFALELLVEAEMRKDRQHRDAPGGDRLHQGHGGHGKGHHHQEPAAHVHAHPGGPRRVLEVRPHNLAVQREPR